MKIVLKLNLEEYKIKADETKAKHIMCPFIKHSYDGSERRVFKAVKVATIQVMEVDNYSV